MNREFATMIIGFLGLVFLAAVILGQVHKLDVYLGLVKECKEPRK